MSQKIGFLDIETYSECDLTVHGSHIYSMHPSTEILCMQYAIGKEGKLNLWLPGDKIPEIFFEDVIWHGWNTSGFEYYLFKNLGAKYGFPKLKFFCDMQLAASWGLPLSLKACGKFLELESDFLKSKNGTLLINKLCCPQKITKKNQMGRKTPTSDPELFSDLYNYCGQDVIANREIYYSFPKGDFFTSEKAIVDLTNRINERGILIDLENVKIIKDKLNLDAINRNKRIEEITKGEVKSILQTQKGVSWVRSQNVFIENFTADSVEKTLQKKIPGNVKEFLEIRQALAQSSVKKYAAMKDYADLETHRVYNTLIYCGASRTGRFAGRAIQPQNLPRLSFDSDLEAEQALFKIRNSSIEEIEKIYEMPFPNLAKKLLRQMIIAPKDKFIIDGDFKSAENKAASWVAGDETTLQLFAKDLDQYRDMAVFLWKVKYQDVTKEQRQIGKKVILAAMYGQGAKGLQRTLAHDNINISEETAKQYVTAYRTKYVTIANFWYELENKTKRAIQNNSLEKAGPILIKVQGDYLFIKLPSGRTLNYYKPALEITKQPWGENLVITFKSALGRDNLYGSILFQNIVQAISRDVLCNSLLNLDKAGFDIILSLHDEITAEGNEDDVEKFAKIMSIPPDWAPNILPTVETFCAKRFRK